MEALRAAEGDIKYAIWQRERGVANGLEHLQGYVEFIRPVRIVGAKSILGSDRYHLEKRQGTREQAIQYCEKLSTRVCDPEEIHPENRGRAQGSRSDIHVVGDIIRAEGLSCLDIAERFPGHFIRYHRGIERLIEILRPVVSRSPPRVTIIWGRTGVGKSCEAHKICPDAFWLTRPQNGAEYILGYESEKNIVIDEFYSWLKYDFLLRLLDCHPLTVNTQGSRKKWCAERIVFTSNQNPREWYPGISDQSALWRRIDTVIHMDHLPGHLATSPVPESPDPVLPYQ